MKLTDQTIRSLPLTTSGQRYVNDDAVSGLMLCVGTRAKTFTLMIRKGEQRKRHTLGQYNPPHFTLAMAREKARNLLAEARLKKDEPSRITFAEAFETYDRVHVSTLRQGSQRAIRQTFKRRFSKKLDRRVLIEIKATEIAPIIDTMLDTPTEMHNAFVYLGMFFTWCVKRGYIEIAPTTRMEKPKKPPSRDRVLTPEELVAVYQAAEDDDYGRIVRLAILSGQRIGQWAGLRREYLGTDTITWPAEVMKGRRSHILPMTDAMRALIPEDRIGLIFPTMNSRSFSNWSRAKNRLDAASGVNAYTHHDLRRSWATISAEELGIEWHIIESVLAHVLGTQVARTYNRARYLEPMRKALFAFNEWLHTRLSTTEETTCLTATSRNSSPANASG